MKRIRHYFSIRRSISLRVLVLALVPPALLVMTACSAASKSAQEPAAAAPESMAASSDPRAEIDRLWNEIEQMQGRRAAAGVDAPGEAAESMEVSPASEAVAREPEPMSAGRARPPRQEQRSHPAYQIECPDGAKPDTPRCGDVCSAGGSICANAEAICRIAGDLQGDAWAAEKCESAERACEDAINNCCACSASE